MNQKHYLIKGTFLLTSAGILSRIAGFFYKIFLSRTIGASEIGLFQLIMPIFSLCMAVTCGGVQTALSRFTAEYEAKKNPAASRRLLSCALLFSTGLSVLCSMLLILFADWVAARYLMEAACENLLRITAGSLPFAVIHACICGYYIGIKRISLSAFSQLLEQFIRIFAVVCFYILFQNAGRTIDARIMALGQIAGEIAASLFCVFFLFSTPQTDSPKQQYFKNNALPSYRDSFRQIFSVSLPLGLNRLLTCVLQSMEAALLPQKIQESGSSDHAALSSYGILTGMALPLILFPTAVTSAAATLLLPMVSEAQTLQKSKKIRFTVRISLLCTLGLGFFFLVIFFFGGSWIGTLLFDSKEAGYYIRLLAFTCPFLYLNTTLISVLHGIGKTTQIFIWNLIGFGIRIGSILLLVPIFGIAGYILGTIGSQFFLSCCICFSLRSFLL